LYKTIADEITSNVISIIKNTSLDEPRKDNQIKNTQEVTPKPRAIARQDLIK
jgi:hypothetical protein